MEFWPWVVGAIVVGGAISAAFAGMQGNALAQKFVDLGEIKGKTKQEILKAIGEPPTSISAVGPDETLLQWQKDNYHIALGFHGDICYGVTHEHLGN